VKISCLKSIAAIVFLVILWFQFILAIAKTVGLKDISQFNYLNPLNELVIIILLFGWRYR
jgi:hypothetical protein